MSSDSRVNSPKNATEHCLTGLVLHCIIGTRMAVPMKYMAHSHAEVVEWHTRQT